jgi:hypothetical protein
MKFPRRQPFNRTLLIGFAFMAVANVLKMLLERHTSMPENPRDGIYGLLFGLAIGCVALGVWRMRQPDGRSDGC